MRIDKVLRESLETNINVLKLVEKGTWKRVTSERKQLYRNAAEDDGYVLYSS